MVAFRDYDGPVLKVDVVTREVLDRYEGSHEAFVDSPYELAHMRKMLKMRMFPMNSGVYYRFEEWFDPEESICGKTTTPIYAVYKNRLKVFRSPREAADVLNLGRSTILQYVRKGEGVGLRWGRIDRGLNVALRELGVG